MLVYSSPAAVRSFIGADVYDALSNAIQKDVDALSKEYDTQTMEMLSELSEGVAQGDPVAVSGRIHLSVVLAPVLVRLAQFFDPAYRTINPVDSLYELWNILHEYWDTSTEELSLDCERRRNFARGAAFHHLVDPITKLIPSARFDAMYQHVGKFYSLLDDEDLVELTEHKFYIGVMTNYLPANAESLIYNHDHRMSFMTDSQLDAYVEEMSNFLQEPDLINESGMGENGVYLTFEYWNYMEMRASKAGSKSIYDYPAWKLNTMLHNNDRGMPHFGVATILADFSQETVDQVMDTCKNFSDYELKAVSGALADFADNYMITDLGFLERLTILITQVAPIIAKFYSAGYEDMQHSLWLWMRDAYGSNQNKKPDVEMAKGRILYSYARWGTDGAKLTGKDLRWSGQHALELADHAKLLMEVGPRDRASYEQMLEQPALASGIL